MGCSGDEMGRCDGCSGDEGRFETSQDSHAGATASALPVHVGASAARQSVAQVAAAFSSTIFSSTRCRRRSRKHCAHESVVAIAVKVLRRRKRMMITMCLQRRGPPSVGRHFGWGFRVLAGVCCGGRARARGTPNHGTVNEKRNAAERFVAAAHMDGARARRWGLLL